VEGHYFEEVHHDVEKVGERTGMNWPLNAIDIYIYILFGGLEHFLFFHILGIIIPTDFHIFQRGRAQPPTSIYVFAKKCMFENTKKHERHHDTGRNLGDVLARRLRLVQEEKGTAPVPIPKAPMGGKYGKAPDDTIMDF